MLRVTGNRILIKPDKIENPADAYETLRSSGMRVIQDEKRERAAQHIGTVVEIGHACWFDFPSEYKQWCRVGDRVIYARHAGKFVSDPDTEEEFVIVNDNDVQCLIVDTKKKGKKK